MKRAGHPSTSQGYGSSKAPILYYVFDLLMLAGAMSEMLDGRRSDPPFAGTEGIDIRSRSLGKGTGLEGLVTKWRDSVYEPARDRAHGARCRSIRAGSSVSVATQSGVPPSTR